MASADVGLVIVAAGSGTRLGADAPKAFVPLAGVPILGHALRGALSCPDLGEVVVVAPPAWLGAAEEVCRAAGSSSRLTVVPGGTERGDSVAAGLAALSEAVRVVLVHDAARCLTPPGVFARVVEAVRGGAAAAVPGIAVVDTIKQVDGCGRVVATPDRSRLRAVQTPQGFSREVLERAHAVTSDATDDAALVERLGEAVLVVEGDERALKVTTREDLDRAARILAG
ncbi:MAG: 2-C-methyl-D-erythritol 4-phosphate cytidylyltransferase [Intrasporangium sp.]|uniref:2-C-methyl-D-erythritol 4-phosphate cytidylyltransferase n=1 Tax=Intrasporangium sp. TaxID=1925024 RepID=UPI003F819A68